MKPKKKDEKLDENGNPVEPKGDEGDEGDEGEGNDEDTKKLNSIIDKKIDKLISAIKENPVRKSGNFGEDPNKERSIIETDPYLRRIRPFVKLSGKMEEFVRDIKVLAMGGAPQSLIKTMSEGDDPSGGFLVPEEFNAEVVRYTAESAVVRPRARVLPMGRDKSTWPKLVQTSSDDFAGISLSWGTESTLATASNPTLGKLTLSVNKLIGLVPLTNELLGDAAIDIANFLVSLFGEAIAYEEDKQFIQGTGVGKPQGIIPVATAVTRASSTTIGYADLISMFTNVPAWAQANAVWLTNMSGLAKIMAIGSNTTGVFFMMPGGFTNAPQMSVFGKPLILTEKVASLGSKGDIIYGDLRRYWIGDRGGLQVASSMHDRFRYDETTVRFIKRTDGQAEQPRAFVVLKP